VGLNGFGANTFRNGMTTANSGGGWITAFGSGAMMQVSKTGGWPGNSFGFGYLAAQSVPADSTNNAFGWQALKTLSVGVDNLAFGANALSGGSGGSTNVAFGYNALAATTTGSRNNALGSGALSADTTGNNNNAVGYNALNANVTGSDNDAFGTNALTLATGSNNTAIGATAGTNITTGGNNTAIGYGAGPSTGALSNTVAIGNGAVVTASNAIQVGNASVTLIGGQVAWTQYSDRRLKKDIRSSDLGLAFLMKLRPVSYRLISGNGRLDYGFIAQEVEAALAYDGKTRDANMVTRKDDDMKTYQLRAADLIAPAVKAVQEQEAAFAAREKDIGAMKADLLKIQDQISALKGGGR
jgi:hypothetical protein